MSSETETKGTMGRKELDREEMGHALSATLVTGM